MTETLSIKNFFSIIVDVLWLFFFIAPLAAHNNKGLGGHVSCHYGGIATDF